MTTGRTIVVGDIHGCYDEFVELLDKLSLGDADRIVAVGDLIVKGEKNREVLDLFMSDARLSSVLGNHDLAMLRHWRGEPVKLNGGQKRCAREFGEDVARYAEYLGTLPLYLDLGTHLVIHAGLRPGVALKDQTVEDLTELRGLAGASADRTGMKWYEAFDEGDKFILFGHWPKREPRKGPRSLGIDTGCVYGGELTAYVVETGELVTVRAHRRYDPPAKKKIVLKQSKVETSQSSPREEAAPRRESAGARFEGLDCAGDARSGARLVLAALFDDLCGALKQALDGEGAAREMRQAYRRLSSVARDFEFVSGLSLATPALEQLGTALESLHEADAAVSGWKELKKKARKKESEELAAGVKELAREFKQEGERARADLGAKLSGQALDDFRREFETWLSTESGAVGQGARFEDVARSVVEARMNELRANVSGLYQVSAPNGLRGLVVAAGHFRHSLEVSAACSVEDRATQARDAAAFQRALEAVCEREAWAATLGAKLAAGEFDAPAATPRKRAALWVLGRLAKDRAKHYREALTLWIELERSAFAE